MATEKTKKAVAAAIAAERARIITGIAKLSVLPTSTTPFARYMNERFVPKKELTNLINEQ